MTHATMIDAPNNFLSISQTRHTCKAYDKNRRIDDATLHAILESLRFAPSSINIQPWCFLVADNDAIKEKISQSMTDNDAHNASKVLNASHSIILCTRTRLDGEHLSKVLDAEEQAGRFKSSQNKEARQLLCQNYLDQYAQDADKLIHWSTQQTFIALGHLLMVARLAGVDATPIGGFDAAALDDALGLSKEHLTASVIVCLGYGSDDDFNKQLPKARLGFDEVIRFI